MSTYKGDSTNRSVPGVSSLPNGPGSLSVNVTAVAGGTRTVIFEIQPAGDRLNMWNFLPTVVIDSTGIDNLGHFSNGWPYGTSGASSIAASRVVTWIDWAYSSDRTNMRAFAVHIENNDSSSHTYYIYVKAYTNSSVTGA